MKATTFNIADTYHSDLNTATDGKVVRRRSKSSVISALFVAAAGAGLLFWTSLMADKTTALYSAALVFGIVAIIIGISLVFFGAKQWIYLPSKSVVRVQSYYIDPAMQYAVCQAIEMRDISQLPKLKALYTSNVRLDVYISDDQEFAGAQTFAYEPYTYKAITPICTTYGEQAKDILNLF